MAQGQGLPGEVSSGDSNPELLPCPFCGGEPRIYYNISPPNNRGYNWHAASISCTMCDAAMWSEDVPERVIKAWNRRTGNGHLTRAFAVAHPDPKPRCTGFRSVPELDTGRARGRLL
ncbi:Lar family restriction alleviation protein [Pelagibacterium sp. IMCC34151]|uniref:Lar family restriction alleviation protein n=1 Tax=Pelagibacterium sediminicola TaxID=2248761 RepID=UPI000E318BB7